MFGISTCWWYGKVEQGDDLLRELLNSGFRGVELEYRITHSMYEQLKSRLHRELRIVSVHNFFPLPEGLCGKRGSGDLFLLSSTDREERQRAVTYSIRTIEQAHDLEASAVILHLGHVDMPNLHERFSQLYQDGKMSEMEGLAFIEEQRAIRKARRQKNLDAALFSLDRLNQEAEKKGVFLGIENRYHFYQIPDFQEVGMILKTFQGGHVRYWHDVGHAHVFENLNILRQKDLLETYSEEMIGIHLHDVKGLDDHFAPGQGDVNYEGVKSYLKPSLIKVLEVHPKVEREDLLEGIRFLEKSGIL